MRHAETTDAIQTTPRRHTGKNCEHKFVNGREEDFCKEYLTEVRFNGDRYEVFLLFKKEHPIIPDNYSLAQNRLVSLLKKLKSSESKLVNQYDIVIKEQLDSDVVELIDKR